MAVTVAHSGGSETFEFLKSSTWRRASIEDTERH
jgi:hypothetical protein